MGQGHAAYNTVLKVPGAPVSFSDEPMTLIPGTGGKVWQISALAKDLWNPSATFAVGDDTSTDGILDPGEEITTTSYQIDYLFGVVIFDTDRTGQDILVSGEYHPHYYMPLGRTVTWGASVETLDAAVFFDEGERNILGRRSVEPSVEILYDAVRSHEPLDGQGGSEQSIFEMLNSGSRIVLEYGPDGTNDATKNGYRTGTVRRAWVRPSENSLEFAPGELVGQEVSFVTDRKRASMGDQFSATQSVLDYGQ